jgi:hypothetical protein
MKKKVTKDANAIPEAADTHHTDFLPGKWQGKFPGLGNTHPLETILVTSLTSPMFLSYPAPSDCVIKGIWPQKAWLPSIKKDTVYHIQDRFRMAQIRPCLEQC